MDWSLDMERHIFVRLIQAVDSMKFELVYNLSWCTISVYLATCNVGETCEC
jgi:hypothetical protein